MTQTQLGYVHLTDFGKHFLITGVEGQINNTVKIWYSTDQALTELKVELKLTLSFLPGFTLGFLEQTQGKSQVNKKKHRE